MVDEYPAPRGVTVTLVFSAQPRSVQEWVLEVPQGCLVSDALARGALHWGVPLADLIANELGIWGKRVGLDHSLQAGDRLEMYRPLKVDPKVARRERFVRQGAKSAGLFAARRVGGKAGY